MVIEQSPKGKNRFRLSGTGSVDKDSQPERIIAPSHNWVKYDASKRDCKIDQRDTYLPSITSQRTPELAPSEGPNDSISQPSIKSRKFSAAF